MLAPPLWSAPLSRRESKQALGVAGNKGFNSCYKLVPSPGHLSSLPMEFEMNESLKVFAESYIYMQEIVTLPQ